MSQSDSAAPLDVSVAIPLFNEEGNIVELMTQVNAALDAIGPGNHEILAVNDGSEDETFRSLAALQSRFHRLRILNLSRNFGHQAAVTAALEHVRGDVVMVMDGDLQDDPGMLATFVAEYRAGADVVYARREGRPEGLLRRAAYAAHYRMMSMLSDSPVQVDAGDFCLMSRRAVDLVNGLPEKQRYVRGLRAWIGLKQVGVAVNRHERHSGVTKYSVVDLFGLAFSGLFAFSRIPLRVATLLGLMTVAGGCVYGIYVLIARVAGSPPQGFATLALLQVIFSGMLLLVLGVIGEYVGRIYEEVKKRPVYVVDKLYESEQDRGRESGNPISAG